MASIISQKQYGNSSCLPAINLNCLRRSEDNSFMPNLINQDHTKVEMKQTEDVLASELSKLSVHERTKALDDLHCVGEDLQETPEMIEQSLEKFEETLRRENDPFYDMAVKQNRAYVEDRSFRLRFIRANMHDVGKAVTQMLHLLRNKAKYFGIECVGRDVTLNDFKEEEQKTLMSGVYHVQWERDQNGRVIVYALSETISRCSANPLCRVAYYTYFNVLSALPEVQMKGLVFIFYDITKVDETPTLPSFSLSVALMDMIKCLPIRFSAVHFCMKTRNNGHLSIFDPFIKLVLNLATEYSRVRTKVHYGSDLELQYNLRGHGINIDSCPINSGGHLREDILNIWLYEYLRAKEPSSSNPIAEASVSTLLGSSSLFALDDQALDFDSLNHSLDDAAEEFFGGATSELLPGDMESSSLANTERGEEGNSKAARITPKENDILLGRGKHAQNNLGNIRFREFVEKHKDAYAREGRRGRREIINRMKKVLASKGVRFLKQLDKDVWVVSNAKETETKIAQLFREFRKQKL